LRNNKIYYQNHHKRHETNSVATSHCLTNKLTSGYCRLPSHCKCNLRSTGKG